MIAPPGLPATYEPIGTTALGDPEILVTIQEPHPCAGKQYLCRSTASMDHLEGKRKSTGKVTYLVDDYPLTRHPMDTWHGAFLVKNMDELVADVVQLADWWHRREQIADRVSTGDLREHLDRFERSLYGATALRYEQEWSAIKDQIARIELAMSTPSAATGDPR